MRDRDRERQGERLSERQREIEKECERESERERVKERVRVRVRERDQQSLLTSATAAFPFKTCAILFSMSGVSNLEVKRTRPMSREETFLTHCVDTNESA